MGYRGIVDGVKDENNEEKEDKGEGAEMNDCVNLIACFRKN